MLKVEKRNRTLFFQRFSSPRHRMMTCTSGINDSMPRLSPTSDDDRSSNPRTDHSNETSLFVMQNRPPCVSSSSTRETKNVHLTFQIVERTISSISVGFRWSRDVGISEEFPNRIQRKTSEKNLRSFFVRTDASAFQVIQFGRIENNCYTLDFEWPFSPLQAFAVALANITQRLK